MGSRRASKLRPTRLVYPVIVSTDEWGFPEPKTWGFIKLGSKQHRRLEQVLRRVYPGNIGRMHESKFAHTAVADKSKFFLKSMNQRWVEAIEKIGKLDLWIEKPIQDLELGEAHWKYDPSRNPHHQLGLFSREGLFALREIIHKKGPKYERLRKLTQKKLPAIINQMEYAVTKLHSEGWVHGHLHAGNWAISKSGKVKMLDLSMAHHTPNSIRNQMSFVFAFGKEIGEVANTIVGLKIAVGEIDPSHKEHAFKEEVDKIIHWHTSMIKNAPTWGNFYEEMREQARRAIR